MATKSLRSFIENAKKNDSYWTERVKSEFAMDIVRLLRERKVSKSDFARQIGVSSAYISKVLRGDENLTIATMVKIVRALEGRLHIHVGRKDCEVRWLDIAQNAARDTRSPGEQSAVEEWRKGSFTTRITSWNTSAANEYEDKPFAA